MLNFYDKSKSNLKILPSPNLLDISRKYSFLASMWLTIVNPNPWPPDKLFRLWSTLKNLSVNFSISFWGIPIPSSSTEIESFFEDFVFAVNKTLFPLGVYLSALDNRLLITKSNSPDENKIILSLAASISIWRIIPAFLNKFL